MKRSTCPPTGIFTDRTTDALRKILNESTLKLFTVELSLDGMPDIHDDFRKTKHSFRDPMETYDTLAELQKEDPRLQIHAISTATEWNMAEIRLLTTYSTIAVPG